MSFESLKLPKVLSENLFERGFLDPFSFQSKILPRISGGQELICVGPEGSGKTTSLVIGVLARLKYGQDMAPRALVLVASKEKAVSLVDLFETLGAKLNIRVTGLYAGAGLEGQREALAEGTDIIVGTPDRVLAIYLKSALNMNKLQHFVLDDADGIIKQGYQSQIHQLALSIPKCQRIVFSEVYHDKLERLTSAFQTHPQLIEYELVSTGTASPTPLLLYKVPNYKTKQNLLNLLMQDALVYQKVIVFVNTKLTCQNLYKSLNKRFPEEAAILKPSFGSSGFRTVQDFKRDSKSRILIWANEIEQMTDFKKIDCLVHFDLPEDISLFIDRIQSEDLPLKSVTFSTDIELTIVNKIEHVVGKKMEVLPLPDDLIVEGSRKKKQKDEESSLETKPVQGQGAFHDKKASNAKDYNWGWKEKNKLFGKKYKKHNKK